MIAFAKDWKVWVAAGVAVVVAILYILIVNWGDARYREGAKDQRIAWQDDLIALQEKAAGLERELVVVRQERDLARQQRDVARRQSLAAVEEEIQNAPDVETALSAFVEYRDGLRNARRIRHDAARADYLSSITPTGGADDPE